MSEKETGKKQEKHIILHPSWRYYIWAYVLALLVLPFAGAGIVIFYNLYKRRKAHQYIITDNDITAMDGKYVHHVDLVDIDHIELQQNWYQHLLGVGTLVLATSASDMQLKGPRHPDKYKQIIEQAISVQKQQGNVQHADPQPNRSYKPGGMSKIDYLTGLWQQGLLSDEDYQNERQHLK